MRAVLKRDPKLQGKRHSKRFPFFLLLSCLIHATLILLLAYCFAREMVRKHKETLPPPEVTLEIITPEKKDRPFVEAKEATDKAPEKAPFQSDENTKAASEQPPEGSLPLPSQQGVTQSAMELQNQRHTAGEKPASASGNPLPPQPNQPRQQRDAKSPSTPTPTPAATPVPTPTPQESPTAPTPPPPNSVKLIEPPKEQRPNETSPSSSAPPPSTPGTPGARKGYQPETRQTVIRGSISNRGRSSVAAEATPIGRYKKRMSDAIGSRWYYYVNERMGLLSIGTVDVSFKVTPSGKVTGLRVVRTNSNESLTDCSLRSIMDAKLPPIPPEVAATLQNGTLEIDYSFTIY